MSIATDFLDEIASRYQRGEQESAISAAKDFIRLNGVGEWGRYAVSACDYDERVASYFRERGGEL